MKKIKVKARLLTKEFDLYKTRSEQIKAIFAINRKKVPKFWALKGVSFDIYEGEAVGIVGINGSGKSTLSNVISRVIPQTSGSLEVNGKVSVIAIGAGLNGKLSGQENIRLKALMMGLTNKEVDQVEDDIVEFADLGAFIDQPVKNYSSGMRSRLGFSIAIHQNPDILIIDEALSVGDQTFYQKCIEKMVEFKSEGKTIIFVSHSLGQVEALCDRTIWMHYGDLREDGPTEDVLAHYREFTKEFNALSVPERRKYQQEYKNRQTTFSLSELNQKVTKDQEEKYKINSEQKDKLLKRTRTGQGLSFISWVLLVFLTVFCVFLGVHMVSTFDTDPNNPSVINQKKLEAVVRRENKAAKKANKNSWADSQKINGTKYRLQDMYSFQKGDTMVKIAKKYHITFEQLQEANPQVTGRIKLGQVLLIPATDSNNSNDQDSK
ncbi:ATP-binding cassette domain-containing protein [Ligilactobacillus acidipiscis]|uniref:Teichoic acid transport system ATP-binding protein n=1 Tax=Ligilactobacillus acidipiscis TaxID=89059 RepID=A0A0R2JYC5_9LACO|nr:ATP-binding cassette domain-containing protein [Ligilactobacillus acidipiscis]KRN82027.1 teichoic acid transport system ATP-binding protein [Ligilactobacillus acidipiscis]